MHYIARIVVLPLLYLDSEMQSLNEKMKQGHILLHPVKNAEYWLIIEVRLFCNVYSDIVERAG